MPSGASSHRPNKEVHLTQLSQKITLSNLQHSLHILLFQKYHNNLCCPSKILHKHFFLKTMLTQNFGGTTRSIMACLKVMKFNRLLILMNIVHHKFNFTASHSHTSFLSLSFVIITIMGHWWYQIILQKSLTVHDKGPARRMLLSVVRNIQITYNSIEKCC